MSTHKIVLIISLAALTLGLGCASATTSAGSESSMKDAPPAVAQDTSGEVAIRAASALEFEPIYFDTDHSILREDARATLKRYAGEILEHPEWGEIVIDGHCDETGSEEYNLALGERRAAAVVRYLADLGVPKSRLVPRTFGEHRPAVAGHDEKAWRFNRRSEVQVEALKSASR